MFICMYISVILHVHAESCVARRFWYCGAEAEAEDAAAGLFHY